MESNGRKRTYDELVDLVGRLEARIAEQDKRIAELERQLAAAKKNSGNSSKPPSSDITKPPKKKGAKRRRRKKRSIGGQEGHPKQESNLTVEDADHVQDYYADQHPETLQRDLVPAPGLEPKVLFQYELVDTPVELTAHVAYPYMDQETGEVVYAPFPREVEAAGLLGPRLTAFAACLKGGIHASYTGTEKVLGFLGVDVCRATICKKIKNTSAALESAYGELLDALAAEEVINVDETGHKDHPFDKPEDHKKHWIWVFAAASFTVFKIFNTRSTDALRQVLGSDCAALIGADLYSSYTCFMKEANIKVQFCWAHLIRDIKFLSDATDKVTANYGNRLLELCRLIFHLQHQRADLGEAVFRRRMMRLKEHFLATGCRSQASGSRDMVARLKQYGEEYFLFLENPQIEPTNNLAEREIRHCVIDRRITQGTRGSDGQRWCERIWSILATCSRQQRDAFAFVADSVRSFYFGQPQPSLLHP
jgi:transposase